MLYLSALSVVSGSAVLVLLLSLLTREMIGTDKVTPSVIDGEVEWNSIERLRRPKESNP